MKSPSTPIADIDTLIALCERINSGDESVYDEIAELLTRVGFSPVRAAFTGSPPPGFLASYIRGDLMVRPNGPVAQALGLVPRTAKPGPKNMRDLARQHWAKAPAQRPLLGIRLKDDEPVARRGPGDRLLPGMVVRGER